MDTFKLNQELVLFSSKLLELKENIEKTSIDLQERQNKVETLELALGIKENKLFEKEKLLNEENDRLESFKKASIMNKIYKELENLKLENKLLKQSFYKRDNSKSTNKKYNWNFLRNLKNDMGYILLKVDNINLKIDLENTKKKNTITTKIDLGFLTKLKTDMTEIIKTSDKQNNEPDQQECRKVTHKGKEYLSDGKYLYDKQGNPVGYKTTKGYKLYKVKSKKK